VGVVDGLAAMVILVGDGQGHGYPLVALFGGKLAGGGEDGFGGGQVLTAHAGDDPAALGGFFVDGQNIFTAGDDRHDRFSPYFSKSVMVTSYEILSLGCRNFSFILNFTALALFPVHSFQNTGWSSFFYNPRMYVG